MKHAVRPFCAISQAIFASYLRHASQCAEVRETPISKYAKFDRTPINCKSRHELLPRATKTSHQFSADDPAAHQIFSNYFRISENAQPKIFRASTQTLLQNNNAMSPANSRLERTCMIQRPAESIQKTIRSNSNEIAPLHPSHRISCAQRNNHTHALV